MSRRVFAVIAMVLGSSFALPAQGFAHYRDLFWQQMSATCRPALRWEKSVTEIDEDGKSTTETKVFAVDCYHGSAVAGETTIPLTKDEFSLLFEYAYDNPYCAPYLDLTQGASGISATVKSGQEAATKLRLQKFELDPATGKLLAAAASIVKGSALYDLEVHIEVRFDAAGHYQSHHVETKTDVLMGGSVHTTIEARLLP